MSILARATAVSIAARQSGALVPIASDFTVLRDNGIDFVVRIARNLERKEQAATIVDTTKSTAPQNPFLPYDERLWVTNIGDHHAVLLNKFNVIDNHLLIVTRHYENQQQLLTRADFDALAPLIESHGGLGFYNGGKIAGASQHHKHLQWIPGIDVNGELRVPIESALPDTSTTDWSIENMPFPMAVATLRSQQLLAEQCWDIYQKITRALGIDRGNSIDRDTAMAARPYNLLLTRNQFWIVLRQQENFDSISLNAMAYAGSFFVKDQTSLQHLQQHGPLAALRTCAVMPKRL